MRSAVLCCWIISIFSAGCSSSKTESSGGPPPKDVKDDTELIPGIWQVVEGYKGTHKRSESSLRERTVIVTAENMTIMDGKRTDGVARYTLKSGTSPRQVDLVPAQGGDKGRTLPGIYELAGDTLKICWNDMGGERPKSFDTKGPPEGLEMMVIQRIK